MEQWKQKQQKNKLGPFNEKRPTFYLINTQIWRKIPQKFSPNFCCTIFLKSAHLNERVREEKKGMKCVLPMGCWKRKLTYERQTQKRKRKKKKQNQRKESRGIRSKFANTDTHWFMLMFHFNFEHWFRFNFSSFIYIVVVFFPFASFILGAQTFFRSVYPHVRL